MNAAERIKLESLMRDAVKLLIANPTARTVLIGEDQTVKLSEVVGGTKEGLVPISDIPEEAVLSNLCQIIIRWPPSTNQILTIQKGAAQ